MHIITNREDGSSKALSAWSYDDHCDFVIRASRRGANADIAVSATPGDVRGLIDFLTLA